MKNKIKKTQRIKYIFVGTLLIAVGVGGFFLGKNAEFKHTQEEKTRDILLNRCELKGLGNIKGRIYVTGHKSPDSDTVSCSIAYASLLRKLVYDAIPVILGILIGKASSF